MAISSPLITVLIPTSGRWNLCKEAIRSVLLNGFDTTAGNVEIIISDDSADRHSWMEFDRVMDELTIEHPSRFSGTSVQCFPNTGKRGKPENWQAATTHAHGRYIFKLDDDDEIAPCFLQRSVGILEANPSVASVYSAYVEHFDATGEWRAIIDEDYFPKQFVRLDAKRKAWIVLGQNYARAVLVNEGGFPLNQKTAAVYRREAAQKINWYEDACEDFAFSAALGLVGDVAYFPEPLYFWRRHEGNNINDPAYSWQLSNLALDGLANITLDREARLAGSDWASLIDRCKRALPIYYLYATLSQQGIRAAKTFWNTAKLESDKPLPAGGTLLLLAARILPLQVLRIMFQLYRGNPWLRTILRLLVT